MAKVKNVANSQWQRQRQRHVLFHLFEFEWQTGKKPKAFELKFNGPQRGEIQLSAYCAYTQCRQSVRIRNTYVYICVNVYV